MQNKPSTTISIVTDREKRNRDIRIRRLHENPDFLHQLQSLKALASNGASLPEIRHHLHLKRNSNRWKDLLHVFASTSLSTETIALELIARNRFRYQELYKMCQTAIENDDINSTLKCLLAMTDSDGQYLEIVFALGLIQKKD